MTEVNDLSTGTASICSVSSEPSLLPAGAQSAGSFFASMVLWLSRPGNRGHLATRARQRYSDVILLTTIKDHKAIVNYPDFVRRRRQGSARVHRYQGSRSQ